MAAGKLRTMANRKCWAASIKGCAGKISGEHIASESVLKAAKKMNPRLELVRIQMDGSALPLSIPSAVVNNLCEAHNGALSPLDCEAQKLMQFIAAAMERSTLGARVETIKNTHEPMLEQSFDGELLERWALKTFLNHFSARGNAGPRDGLVSPSGVHIVEAVFTGKSLPPGFGLYSFIEPHERVYASPTFSIDTIEVCAEGKDTLLRFPGYLIANFGPLQLAVSANVTDLPQEDWHNLMHEFWASQPTGRPKAIFHPRDLTLAVTRKDEVGPSIPYARARLHWK
jgi:hypothetical protein